MKQEQDVFVALPLFISLLLYSLIIFGVFYYLGYSQDNIKKYSSKKDSFLEVHVVSKPEAKEVKKVEVKKEEKKKEEVKKEEVKTALKQSSSVKDLFGKIKTKDVNLSKPIPTNKNKQAKQSRKKSSKKNKPVAKNASKLVKSLTLDSAPSKASSVGEYNEFYGRVQETLDGLWQQTNPTESGANAEVEINIDKNGNFSYSVVTFSYNNDFNKKLRDFLEQMRGVKFPKNKKNYPTFVTKFTDKLE